MSDAMDWGSEDLKSATTFMSNWYKAKLGKRDIIRVVDKCYPVWTHTWVEGRFRTSMCSMATSGKCPYCERQGSMAEHKRQMRWATTILHITSQAIEGKPKPVLKALAWRFANDKKDILIEIHESGDGLAKTDISIKVAGQTKEDENFQKLSMLPNKKDVLSVLTKKYEKEIKAELGKKEAIKREYLPEYEDLAKFFRKDDKAEVGKFDVEDFDMDELEDSDKKESDSKNNTKGSSKKKKKESSDYEDSFEFETTEKDDSEDGVDNDPLGDLLP
jgi:hypothetical protein